MEETEFSKDAIRRLMRGRRKALSPEARASASAAVCGRLAHDVAIHLSTGASGHRGAVAVYFATPEEIDLADFMREMLACGVKLVSPRWDGAAYGLAAVKGLSPCDLRRGPMGILEPAGADYVDPADVAAWIVPGLAFTADGGRIGYGGGWYDRLLADSADDALKIGVAFDFQIVPDIPAEPHDIRLDRVIAESP